MQLNTIEGITNAITTLLAEKHEGKPSPLMLTAYEGVLNLIERKAKNNQQIAKTVADVRLALGITQPPEEDSLVQTPAP